jgi:ELWxxDGT repeat protein
MLMIHYPGYSVPLAIRRLPKLLNDLHYSHDLSPRSADSSATGLTNVNGTLLFTASDGIHGQELWKSDGTAAGTVMVDDIGPGSASADPSDLTNVNGTLFFAANDGIHGNELWKSDGTAAGTVMIKNLWPGGYTGYYGGYYINSSNPSNLTSINGTLFFTAHSATNNSALYKSDGTAAGTVELTTGGNPGNLTNVTGTLFFAAGDATHGTELWKSDGTIAGTTLVKDIAPGGSSVTTGSPYYGYTTYYVPNSSNPSNLTNVNGTLFFTADNGTHGQELWKSDGTAAGTVMVTDIRPGSSRSYTSDLTNVNGTLFFAASGLPAESELWKSDSTAAGTVMVSAINSNGSGAPSWLTNVNGTLYFGAVDGTHGDELWRSDGTPAGTFVVADINRGSGSSAPAKLTNVNGTLFFSANDGTHGNELWEVPSSTATAASLAVSGFPSSTTAGVPDRVTVTALNADGSIDTSYTGTVHFASSDGQATLPSDYTFAASDAGVHTFSAVLKTAGTASLTASDGSILGSENGITVDPAAVSQLTLAAPSSTVAGSSFSITVTARDPYNNVATGYSGTVAFSSSDTKANLPAKYTFTTGNAGSSSFTGVALKTAGTQPVTAADTATASITASASVAVSPAPANEFILAAPTSVRAGVSFRLTVTVEDAYGNVVTNYLGTIRFSSTDTRATLPANFTFTATAHGVHTYTGLVLRKTGYQQITVTDTHQSTLLSSVIVDVV